MIERPPLTTPDELYSEGREFALDANRAFDAMRTLQVARDALVGGYNVNVSGNDPEIVEFSEAVNTFDALNATAGALINAPNPIERVAECDKKKLHDFFDRDRRRAEANAPLREVLRGVSPMQVVDEVAWSVLRDELQFGDNVMPLSGLSEDTRHRILQYVEVVTRVMQQLMKESGTDIVTREVYERAKVLTEPLGDLAHDLVMARGIIIEHWVYGESYQREAVLDKQRNRPNEA